MYIVTDKQMTKNTRKQYCCSPICVSKEQAWGISIDALAASYRQNMTRIPSTTTSAGYVNLFGSKIGFICWILNKDHSSFSLSSQIRKLQKLCAVVVPLSENNPKFMFIEFGHLPQ